MATLWVPLLATAVLPLPPPLLTLAFCRQVPTIPTYPNHQTFTSLLRWSGCLIPPPNNQPRFIARAILLFAESIGSLIATFTRLCRVVCIVHVRIFANVRTRTHCLRIFETQMIHSLPFFFFQLQRTNCEYPIFSIERSFSTFTHTAGKYLRRVSETRRLSPEFPRGSEFFGRRVIRLTAMQPG